jgi:hypothetical protein
VKLIKKQMPQSGQVWPEFFWKMFPKGVSATFVLVDRRTGSVVLSKPTRWSYEMPSVEIQPGGTLDDGLVAFKQKIESAGLRYVHSGEIVVLGGLEISGTLHAVVKVTVEVFGSFEAVQPDKAYQVESGLALSNPACEFVPALLGWRRAKWTMNELVEEKDVAVA